MKIEEMIAEILESKKVDKIHVEYWDKVEEESEEECLIKIDMDKEFI